MTTSARAQTGFVGRNPMTRVAILLLALTVACHPTTAAVAAPTITTGPLSWKISETEYGFNAEGTAPILISDSTHAYMVVYRVNWESKLDPGASADTSMTIAVIVPGVGEQKAHISDHETRCSEYTRTKCLRSAKDPSARLVLVGWTRFERP